MATNFPTGLDTFTNPTATDTLNSVTVPHATQHDNLNDAVLALETKVGINSSADTNSLDYKVAHLSPAAPGYARGPNTAATLPIFNATSAVVAGSGTVQYVSFMAPASFTTTKVRLLVAAVGGSNTFTGVALYSMDTSTGNLTRIAQVTGTTFWNATGAIDLTWTASTAITAGLTYAIGVLSVGGSNPQFKGCPNLVSDSVIQAEAQTTPWICQFQTGQSSMPASYTNTPANALGVAIYAVVH